MTSAEVLSKLVGGGRGRGEGGGGGRGAMAIDVIVVNVLSLYKTPNKNMSVCLSVCLSMGCYFFSMYRVYPVIS